MKGQNIMSVGYEKLADAVRKDCEEVGGKFHPEGCLHRYPRVKRRKQNEKTNVVSTISAVHDADNGADGRVCGGAAGR